MAMAVTQVCKFIFELTHFFILHGRTLWVAITFLMA